GPPIFEVEPCELATREAEAVGRVGVHHVADRVVARRKVVAVLDEVHVVSEARETAQILEVAPHHSAQRPPHDVAEHDDAKALGSRFHDPHASSISRVSTRSESKYSSAIARAALACRA